MGKRKNYMPSPKGSLDLANFNQFTDNPRLWWQGYSRVPLKTIKKPNKYPNPINPAAVLRILIEFYPEAWEPIMVNDDFFLIDGQHRLEAAKQMGHEFIDVILVPEASIRPTSE